MKALTDESRINAYINKQLVGDELRRFEEDLKSNSAFKRKFIAISLKQLDPPVEGDTPKRQLIETVFASFPSEKDAAEVEELNTTSSNLIFVHLSPAFLIEGHVTSSGPKPQDFFEQVITAIGDLIPDSIIEVLLRNLIDLVVPEKKLNILFVDFDSIDDKGIKALQDFQAKNMAQTLILAFVKSEDPRIVFKALKAGVSGMLLKSASANLILNAIKEMEEYKSFFEERLSSTVLQFMRLDAPKEDSNLVMLTIKQREILMFLSQGYNMNQIAESLGISTGTVATHIKGIYSKMQSKNTSEIILKWLKFQDRE